MPPLRNLIKPSFFSTHFLSKLCSFELLDIPYLNILTYIYNHNICVVYFDQQMHACACIRMVKNNEKYKQLITNLLYFT